MDFRTIIVYDIVRSESRAGEKKKNLHFFDFSIDNGTKRV